MAQRVGCANHATEGKLFSPPIHCCDVTKPPYLFSGKLCTSPLLSKRLFVYAVCCRRCDQCFSVLRTRKSDVILTQWATVVGEVTSPYSDTMCHSCAPVVYPDAASSFKPYRYDTFCHVTECGKYNNNVQYGIVFVQSHVIGFVLKVKTIFANSSYWNPAKRISKTRDF